MKQETAAFVADDSPNRKQFGFPRDKICGPMQLDTGNYLTQLMSVGFHAHDFVFLVLVLVLGEFLQNELFKSVISSSLSEIVF